MAGPKAKNKQELSTDEKCASIKRGKLTFKVNMKIEAQDSQDKWFEAKIMKINHSTKQILVHFDGWNSRHDIWLPYNSSRFRVLKSPNSKAKAKGKEWRLRDRVIAKWGPAGRIYPATISKIVSASTIEVTFYDGFKKVLAKNSLKADTEKLYRQYESSVRKKIVSPSKEKASASTEKVETSSVHPQQSNRIREKRRHVEPVAMADYVMTSRKIRKTEQPPQQRSPKQKQLKPKEQTTLSLSMKKEKSEEAPSIPKVKLKLGVHTIAICTSESITGTENDALNEKKIERCGIEIEKKKNKNYVMFPTMDEDEEKKKRGRKNNSKDDITNFSNDSEKESHAYLKRSSRTSKNKQSPKGHYTPVGTPKHELKLKFPFANSDKLKDISQRNEDTDSLQSRISFVSEDSVLSVKSEEKESLITTENSKCSKVISLGSSIFAESEKSDTLKSSDVKITSMEKKDATGANKQDKIEPAKIVNTKQHATLKTLLSSSTVTEKTVVKRRVSERNEMKKRESEEQKVSKRKRSSSLRDEAADTKTKNTITSKTISAGKTSKEEKSKDIETSSSKSSKNENSNVSTVSKNEKQSKIEKDEITYSTKTLKDDRTSTCKSKVEKDETFSSSKTSKNEISMKSSNDEKSSSSKASEAKNFEQKYELFKQKWKAEKERRRLLKDAQQSFSSETVIQSSSDNKSSTTNTGSAYTSSKPIEDTKQLSGSSIQPMNSTIHPEPISKQSSDVVSLKPSSSTSELAKPEVSPTLGRSILESQLQNEKSSDDAEIKLSNLFTGDNSDNKVYPIIVPSSFTSITTTSISNSNHASIVTKKKGWPKGRPRKRKVDDLEYNSAKSTFSLASMVDEERPSQKSRPPVPFKKTEPLKNRDDTIIPHSSENYLGLVSKNNVSLTQIVASRIQRKAHQQKLQSVNPLGLQGSTLPASYEEATDNSELNLDCKMPTSTIKTAAINKKKKNLDFITGRLQFKKKMEALKQREEEANQIQQLQHQYISQQKIQTMHSQVPNHKLKDSSYNYLQNTIQGSHSMQLPQQQYTAMIQQPNVCSNVAPLSSYPQFVSKHFMSQPTLSNCTMKPNCTCQKCTQECKEPEKLHHEKLHTSTDKQRKPSSMSSINAKLRQKIMKRTQQNVFILPKPPHLLSVKDSAELALPANLTLDLKGNANSLDTISSFHRTKQKRNFELRRPKSESEKELMATPSNEFKCTRTGCGKAFRKFSLLQYHLKYYHTAKPTIRRSRSSVSVSSTDSNPAGINLISPNLTSPLFNDALKKQDNTSTTRDEGDTSEEETESEEEGVQSVDECVKCICEDDCELGFMIQCEQCFTWQHGECVGYATQKAVPLFYLCHICSKPKGLRLSCSYNNDYTWYRHGRLPPIEKDDRPNDSKQKEADKTVNKEDEEVLSSIMLVAHAMMSDLYNIKDALQVARNKLISLNQSPPLERSLDISVNLNETDDEQLEELLKIIENQSRNNGKEIREEYEENSENPTTEYEQSCVIPTSAADASYHKTSFGDVTNGHDVNVIKNENGDSLKETLIKSEVKNSLSPDETDEERDKKKTDSAKDMKQDVVEDSKRDIKTEVKEEASDNVENLQTKIVKREIEVDLTRFIYRSIKQDMDVPSYHKLSKKDILSRFQLLVEIERIEDIIEDRVNRMNKQLDELENEYTRIDRSKEILKEFREQYELHDMKSLQIFLKKIKWTNIIEEYAKS